ncbi:hypothetical protein QV000_07210 [Stenotrophomonas maltophilia]
MDVEQRARELLAAEWKKQRDFGAPDSFATYMVEVIEKGEWDSAPDMCALVASLTPPDGFALVPVERGAMYVCPTCHGVGSVTQQVHDKILAACPEVKYD